MFDRLYEERTKESLKVIKKNFKRSIALTCEGLILNSFEKQIMDISY